MRVTLFWIVLSPLPKISTKCPAMPLNASCSTQGILLHISWYRVPIAWLKLI